MRIDCIEDSAGLAGLAGEWNRLLGESGSDCFFLTWEWLSTWWRLFGEPHRLLVVTARDPDGTLVGVAPLMIGRAEGWLSRPIRFLTFLGQDNATCPEYLDFFVRRGREEEITGALCRYLLEARRGCFDVVRLLRWLCSSPNLPLVLRAFAAAGIPLRERCRIECPYAALPPTWDEYLATRSSHFRKRIRYNQRRLDREGGSSGEGGTAANAAEGPVRLVLVDQPARLDAALDQVLRLHHTRFGADDKAFVSPRVVEFHRQLCRRLLPQGRLLLALLTVGDQVLAAKYDYLYGNKVWGYQGGWRADLERLEVGSVLVGKLLRQSIEHGLGEYDFLGGADEYKVRWSTASRSMVDLEGCRPSWRGLAYRLGQQGKQRLRQRLGPELVARLARARQRLRA